MQMCGSNKIANFPQSSLNGTMSQANVQNGQQSIADSIFGGKRLRDNGQHTHIDIVSVSVCVSVVMALSFRWLVAASKIIHWERHAQTNGSISMYICVCVSVCVVCVYGYLSSICQFISFVVLLVFQLAAEVEADCTRGCFFFAFFAMSVFVFISQIHIYCKILRTLYTYVVYLDQVRTTYMYIYMYLCVFAIKLHFMTASRRDSNRNSWRSVSTFKNWKFHERVGDFLSPTPTHLLLFSLSLSLSL